MSVLELPQLNTELVTRDIPMRDIFFDMEFNDARGDISLSSVYDLAQNIKADGLLQPITVQPYDKHPPQHYRIVAGHRRFRAFECLKRDTIPAIIREGLTDIQAYALNYVENIQRKDLNMMQEARGIQRFILAGETTETIAKLINRGRSWVTIRRALLGMPKPIQNDAEAGWLTQGQILDLAEIHEPAEQMEIVRKIKEAKGNNERRLPKIGKEKGGNPLKRKKRNTQEVLDMMDHILDETGVTNPFTRAMAWYNGDINDLELYRDMKEYFDSIDVPYSPPMQHAHLMPIIKPKGA